MSAVMDITGQIGEMLKNGMSRTPSFESGALIMMSPVDGSSRCALVWRPTLVVGLLVLVAGGMMAAEVPEAEAARTETGITYRNVIADFEQDPVAIDAPGADGWYLKTTTSGGSYTMEVDPAVGANGSSRSLRMTVSDGVPYWFYLWNGQDEYLNRNAMFPVNRMRFYLKLPQGWDPDPGAQAYNFHIGTYHRDPELPGSHESHNWHFYYHAVLNAFDSDWIRVDLSTVPQHQRAVHMAPVGANPTRPLADLMRHWTRTYFTGVPYLSDPGVGFPYQVWFDEWEFYYQNEGVALQPEYMEWSAAPGEVLYYPVEVRNTSPSEARRFQLLTPSELFNSDNYWTHDVRVIEDTNGDGIHQAGEITEVTSTPLLAAGQPYHVFVRVAVPATGPGSNAGAMTWTALTAFQTEPAWTDDPHIQPSINNQGFHPGTPVVSCHIRTNVAVSTPAPDADPPDQVADLVVMRSWQHSVELGFSAPGDDGQVGRAASYDVRFSTSPIDAASFDQAMPFMGEALPGRVTTWERFVVPPMLTPGTRYYFAVRTHDESHGASAVSNTVAASTLPAAAGNAAPSVWAGAPKTVLFGSGVDLHDAAVSDDGLPSPPAATTVTWTRLSGPGPVVFADPTAVQASATFGSPGEYVLSLVATDGEHEATSRVKVTVRSRSLGVVDVVDLGASEEATTFGVASWTRVLKDVFTDYSASGPAGTVIVTGDNGAYNYQGVQGTDLQLLPGDRIIVHWYNASSSTVQLAPYISFDDPDRRLSGASGTWVQMSPASIAPQASGATELVLSQANAGLWSLINVSSDLDNTAELVCDRITIDQSGAGLIFADGLESGDDAVWSFSAP